MGLFLQHKTKDIHWAIWKMEESLESLLTLLPATRRIFCEQEMQRFTSERRKMEWLSVRVLLYSMLQEDKEIIYSSEGKPSLGDHSFFIRWKKLRLLLKNVVFPPKISNNMVIV